MARAPRPQVRPAPGGTAVPAAGSPDDLCLAIETSCDETAAAVVTRAGGVRASVVASQAALHERYGGVVPELAARHHLEAVLPVAEEALRTAGARWSDVRLVAVTRGPGLPAALLVGLSAAKAIAFGRELPLVGVNHLAAHVYAHVLDGAGGSAAAPGPVPSSDGLPRPSVCLVVSGSHTDLCLLPAGGGLRLLGTTVDDAAGEAFDKVARLLGLGYPGGPAIDRAARGGDPRAVPLPRGAAAPAGGRAPRPGVLGGRWAFSFSGLKTAVAQRLAERPNLAAPDVAAAFQAAVVDTLVAKTLDAAAEAGVGAVLAAGGVAANSALRAELGRACGQRGLALRIPPPAYCTDNAAMVGAAGWAAWAAGGPSPWDLDVDPNLALAL